jgi:hypothetical protein
MVNLVWELVLQMLTGAPRKWNVLSPMNGIVSPFSTSWGLYDLPVETWTARQTHFDTFAFIPNHDSQASVAERIKRLDWGVVQH